MAGLYDLLEILPTQKTVIVLVVAITICIALFQWRNQILEQQLEHAQRGLDGRLNYGAAEAREYFHKIQFNGSNAVARSIYAASQMTLDFVFPIIYTLFCGQLIVCSFQKELAKQWLLLPVMACCADWLENLLTSVMALTLHIDPLVNFASAATGTKWMLLISVAVLLCVRWITAGFRSSSKHGKTR